MSRPVKIKPWQRLDTEMVYTCRVFSLRRDRSRSPRTGSDHDFFILDACDWVNVVPLTADDGVVMVRQYRHGVGDFTLEIPGGMVDAEDPSPLVAARREMVEETGWDSVDLVELGAVHPNPAIQGNRLHTFVARGVENLHETHFDTTEETEVEIVPLAEIPALVAAGTISHALVVSAFYLLDLWRSGAGR
jgi:8-oxo-dGTP pyrophosphatase MutT (NUDIX family)